MTHRLLQPHFFLRALRAQARYACRRATRASALRAHGTHLCELSDNHSSSAGCTWDVQRGGWWRADGSAWKIKVRNEKRLQAREARRVEKAPEKAAEQAHRERFAARWAEEKAKGKEEREFLKRDKEERLKPKSEARQAREAVVGGGAPKKAAGKNEKYMNTQLAAVVLDFKEP